MTAAETKTRILEIREQLKALKAEENRLIIQHVKLKIEEVNKNGHHPIWHLIPSVF